MPCFIRVFNTSLDGIERYIGGLSLRHHTPPHPVLSSSQHKGFEASASHGKD